MSTFSAEHFRDALGHYTTGVTIVTAVGVDGEPVGMTANSFASVSLEPPLVLWSVDRSAPECEDFLAAGHYAVHILRQDQQRLSHQFSDDAIDKFSGVNVSQGIGNMPLLNDFCARLQCEVTSRYAAGDHWILVGRVLDLSIDSAEPLVFYRGKYGKLQS